MKSFSTIAVLTVSMFFFLTGLCIAGSKVKSTNILNNAKIKNSANIAIEDAEANQGSIAIKGANVSGSTIVNNAKIKNSANVAIGLGGKAEANQGAVKISRSVNGVTVVNNADISNSANIAVDVLGLGGLFGTDESNQGSIVIK
ncbi:MAG: hypothetical protein K0U68_02175 [Gammaproteobacteria bacterium]|nr:hypothetical protein [Gammaproteobacteria bacterium]